MGCVRVCVCACVCVWGGGGGRGCMWYIRAPDQKSVNKVQLSLILIQTEDNR